MVVVNDNNNGVDNDNGDDDDGNSEDDNDGGDSSDSDNSSGGDNDDGGNDSGVGSNDIGTRRKRMRFQDEIECTDKRSSRIIALEEKKQQERERKLALTLERKNRSVNHDIRNKGKAKATMEVLDDLSNFFNEDEEGPSKKGHKNKKLYQLITSIKELERQSLNASTSGTNDSSLNGMPLKHILGFIIDFLQREDSDELFAEPVNPDVVRNYYEIIKQPMDFGTMRAKHHEGMYTDLEQFKHDIFLICSNAMNANLPNSKHHQVAEGISRYAKWIFEALSADPQHVDLKFSLNKKRPARKPQNGQKKTSRSSRVAPKRAGRNNATYVSVPETGKRDMYWPPSKPLVSLVLHADKPDIQLKINSNQYKESLLRFVKDLGPTAQRVAAKKLEALKGEQLCIGDTPNQNFLENVSPSQIIHPPTPHTPTQPAARNSQTLPRAPPFLNRPLTITGSAAKGIRNAGIVDIRDGLYQVKKTNAKDNWHACSAALLSQFFLNFNKGGIESSNARARERETMNFGNLSKGKTVSPVENVSASLLGHHLGGVNKPNNTLACGSSSNVFPIVNPTRVISVPQPSPLNPHPLTHNAGNRNSINLNLPELSLVSQPMPRTNLTEAPLVRRQPRPDDIINLSDLRVVPQARPTQHVADVTGNEGSREDEIRSLFEFFDRENRGYLDYAHIVAGFAALEISLENKCAKNLLNACSSNVDGRLDFQEFNKYMDD